VATLAAEPVWAQIGVVGAADGELDDRAWPDGRWAAAGAQHWKLRAGDAAGRDGCGLVWVGEGRVLPVFETVGGSICRAGSIDTDVPRGRRSAGQHSAGTAIAVLYQVTQNERYLQGGEAAAGAAGAAAEGRRRAGSGTRRFIRTRCGWTGCTWRSRSMRSWAAEVPGPQDFREITHQFLLMHEHARDAKTGLLYHGLG